MKFGSLYSYWGTEWKCDYLKTLKKMKEAGCDVLEMGAGHVLEMELGELEAIRAADQGIRYGTDPEHWAAEG